MPNHAEPGLGPDMERLYAAVSRVATGRIGHRPVSGAATSSYTPPATYTLHNHLTFGHLNPDGLTFVDRKYPPSRQVVCPGEPNT